MTAQHTDVIQQIKIRLASLHPHKAILFGSHAWGTPGPETDIDLVVVKAPADFRARMTNTLQVKRLLTDINQQIPLDLLVYSKQEWQQFVALDSSFGREMRQKGKVLL